MKRLDVIPYPNKVEFTGGDVPADLLSSPLTQRVSGMGEEEYTLEIGTEGAAITASGEKGEFYARKTLKQLCRAGMVPCCKISDSPAFSYRGFMIDPVRHMVSIEQTKRLIDAAADVKMNAMHWHLADDQGWRPELASRPLLAEKSAFRPRSTFGSENDNTPHGGSFSKEQMKEIVEYAAERFIEVIPEIDMPGHCTALIHAYPEAGCSGKSPELETKQGIFPNILCAGKDETLKIVFDILDELCEIFPSRYFHIGGDEAPKTNWKTCPDCQKRIREEGLHGEEELQGWFVNKICAHLKEKGKEAVVWNESLHSGMVKNVSVQHWMHKPAESINHANSGGRLIVSDFYHYYCDYPYAMTPLKKTYSYDPLIKGLNEKGKMSVAGVECPLWTEYIKDFGRLCYMAFPRFTAVAETGWTEKENRNAKDFERRFELFENQLAEYGITPAKRSEWNPAPLKRLGGVWQFFKPTVIGEVKGFFKPKD